jgi:hypothetical protein
MPSDSSVSPNQQPTTTTHQPTFGLCQLSIVPVRAEASDKSELVTQLLFGECYEVIQSEEKWLKVRLGYDQYEGWIDTKQHNEVEEKYFSEWTSTPHARSLSKIANVHLGGTEELPVLLGSTLPFMGQPGPPLGADFEPMVFEGTATQAGTTATGRDAVRMAMRFLKAPYLWGGRTLFGIDCSGLTQQVFALCGYQLPRDAWQQIAHGEEVHFTHFAQPGDVAFFQNAEGKIVHVGILLSPEQILHAHGEVRIDRFDHQGIYLEDYKRYSHQLRLIKRLLPAE